MSEIHQHLTRIEELHTLLARDARDRSSRRVLQSPPTPRPAHSESTANPGVIEETSWRDYSERLLALADALLAQLRPADERDAEPSATEIPALVAPRTSAPRVLVPQLSSGATAGDVVRRGIAASVVRLIQQDSSLRLDADPRAVHQARVATRRLRSDLRTFRALLDREWATALREELGWLAGVLGVVRDRDVMLERIGNRAGQLPDADARGVAYVVAELEEQREGARGELSQTLQGERYPALLHRLVATADAPALLLEADLPAPAIVPRLVRRPWRRLAKEVDALADAPTDEELHGIRIGAKRVRYSADAAVPLFGHRARAFARAAASLQEVLGELNDAVVAQRWLYSWADESRSPRAAFAAGELAGLERAAAARKRARWRRAWKELSAPKLRTWM